MSQVYKVIKDNEEWDIEANDFVGAMSKVLKSEDIAIFEAGDSENLVELFSEGLKNNQPK